MKKQFQQHWQSIILVMIACFIIYVEYQAAPVAHRDQATAIFNPFFVAMGKWGIRFLLLSLIITPLYALSGWRFPIKLRKPAGLIAFGFVCVHVGMHILDRSQRPEGVDIVTMFTQPTLVIFGFLAFVILAAMALTSVKPMMKLLGRYWKPLHRMVYLAGLLMMLHSLLAATSGKRSAMGGAESAAELQIYLFMLVALLLLRVPMIRDWFKRVLPFAPQPRKRKRKRQLDDALA